MKTNKIDFKKSISLFSGSLIIGALIFSSTGCAKKKSEVAPETGTSTTSSAGARISGFTWTAQSATGNWNAISFYDATHGLIVGMGGAISKTSNSGSSYFPITTAATTNDLYACRYLTSSNMLIAGSNSTLKVSINQGSTWTNATLPSGIGSVDFRGFYFLSTSIGFVVGGNNTILKTINGGNSWTLSNTGIAGTGTLYSVYFFNSLKGCATGNNGMLYKTIDGGSTWTSSSIFNDPRINLTSINFPTSQIGFITTAVDVPLPQDSINHVLKTVDGGATWTQHYLLIPSASAYAVKFFSPTIGYIVGGNNATNNGFISATIDGGINWTTQTIPASGTLLGLALQNNVNTGAAYAVGKNNAVIKGQ